MGKIQRVRSQLCRHLPVRQIRKALSDPLTMRRSPKAVPYNTSIPIWAYADMKKVPSGSFDPAFAKGIAAMLPDAIPRPEEKETSSSSTGTSTNAIPTVPSTTDVPSKGNGPKGRTDAIVGGAVGGLLGVAIIAVFVFLVRRARNRTRFQSPSSQHPSRNVTGGPRVHTRAARDYTPSFAHYGPPTIVESETGDFIPHNTGQSSSAGHRGEGDDDENSRRRIEGIYSEDIRFGALPDP
ncbi:hypothetical protein NMY22_g3333 [Coprinellus aureogranulatus]|nr:hypothetical protein NMY22_g3333 [Coprinellus aureogranulatus]